jgi:DNA-directed RNA polymerase specialized sigma24 family protein
MSPASSPGLELSSSTRCSVEDLPEKEIAALLNLTRDGVASQLKRIRKGLRIALREAK